jgi:hypothetical protein
VIDQVGGGFHHAAPGKRGKSRAGYTKGYQLLMGALSTAWPQKAVRQNAALQKGAELLFDEPR